MLKFILILCFLSIKVFSQQYGCSANINGKQKSEVTLECKAVVTSFVRWNSTKQARNSNENFATKRLKFQYVGNEYPCVQLDIQRIKGKASFYIPGASSSLGGNGEGQLGIIDSDKFPILRQSKTAFFVLEVHVYTDYLWVRFEFKQHNCPQALELKLLQPLRQCHNNEPCSCASNQVRDIVKDDFGCISSCSCETLFCSASYPNARVGCYQEHMLGNSRNNEDEGVYTWDGAKLGETKELEFYSVIPDECVQYRISRVPSGKLRMALSSSSEKIIFDSNRNDNSFAQFLLPTLQFGEGFKVKVHSLKSNQRIQFKYIPQKKPCPVVLQAARVCQILTSEPSAVGSWLSSVPSPQQKQIGSEGYPRKPFPMTAGLLIHRQWALANAPHKWRRNFKAGFGKLSFGNETGTVDEVAFSNTTGLVLLHLKEPMTHIEPVTLNNREINEVDGEVTFGEISVLRKKANCVNDGRTAVTGEGNTLWQTVHSMKQTNRNSLGGIWLRDETVIGLIRSTGINPCMHRVSATQPVSVKPWLESVMGDDKLSWKSYAE